MLEPSYLPFINCFVCFVSPPWAMSDTNIGFGNIQELEDVLRRPVISAFARLHISKSCKELMTDSMYPRRVDRRVGKGKYVGKWLFGHLYIWRIIVLNIYIEEHRYWTCSLKEFGDAFFLQIIIFLTWESMLGRLGRFCNKRRGKTYIAALSLGTVLYGNEVN